MDEQSLVPGCENEREGVVEDDSPLLGLGICLSVPFPALPSGVHTWGNQQGNCTNSASLSSYHDVDFLREGSG